MAQTAAEPVLEINGLRVAAGSLEAVRGIDLTVPAGGRTGIVGESGAGKSLTALAVMGLLPDGWLATGTVRHGGTDLLALSDRRLSRIRGRTLSMVFQDPLSSLNPIRRVGSSIASVIRRHTSMNRRLARNRTLELLRLLQLSRPESIFSSYPHQLSGGQRQRVMIAMALACNPKLIIADEPTTALDVTVQKEVLRLLNSAVAERGCALLMISHDLPVVAALCDEVVVMYAGRIVEAGPADEVFTKPRHPYTAALLRAQPTMDNIDLDGTARLAAIPGAMPPVGSFPTGCAFRSRCSRATDVCLQLPPVDGEGHTSECWHPLSDGTAKDRR